MSPLSTQWTVQNKGFLNLRASTQIKSLTIANNAWLDLVGKTLTVKTLTITNKTYAAGTYAAAPLGVLVADSVGGGSVVVLGLDRGTAVYFH